MGAYPTAKNMGFLKTLGIRQIVPTKFGKLKETFCRIKFGKLSFTFGKLGFDKLSLTRNIRRQFQLIFDLPGGTFKICKLEFLHLLGYSSGSTGSWDVLRGRWHHTAISGIFLSRGVLSRAGWGCFLCAFLLLLRFSVPAGSAILNRTFRIFLRNFVTFLRRLPDVTPILATIKVDQ